jgi:hypothetical protein
MKAILLTVAAVLALASSVGAQMVKYTDEKGVTHYVETGNMVPSQYRDKVITPNLPVIVREDPAVLRNLNEGLARVRAQASIDARVEAATAKVEAARAQAEAQAVGTLRFQQTSAMCAKREGVDIIHEPGANTNIYGTAGNRFKFDKCMSQSGAHTENK